MQYGLMAEVTQTGMPVYNLYLFSDDDVSEDWEEGKYGRKGGFAVDDEERDVIDFEAVCEVSYSGPTFVSMGNDDDLMAAVDEFGGKLVDMRLNSSYSTLV
jgi:hypothetical protein